MRCNWQIKLENKFNTNNIEFVIYLLMMYVIHNFHILQMLMYLLRLGIVTTLLSETLVSGFTCASAFHVVASQVKDLLGLSIQKRRGLFSFVYVSTS